MSEKFKKHITEITKEYFPFWEPLLKNIPSDKYLFLSKLCYTGTDFSEKKEECVRFFPSELNSTKDKFIECFDWDQNHYSKQARVLYLLKYDPDWQSKDTIYKEVKSSTNGLVSYAVKLSTLEVVNVTGLDKQVAVELNTESKPRFEQKDINDIVFREQEDDHYSKMTIRDIYAIINKKPVSNKPWLNSLINDTTSDMPF